MVYKNIETLVREHNTRSIAILHTWEFPTSDGVYKVVVTGAFPSITNKVSEFEIIFMWLNNGGQRGHPYNTLDVFLRSLHHLPCTW